MRRGVAGRGTLRAGEGSGLRGSVELIEDSEKALPRRLSQKHLGEDPPAEPGEVLRLIVRVTPQKVTGFSV